jgi:hypothetical protein
MQPKYFHESYEFDFTSINIQNLSYMVLDLIETKIQ